MIRISSLLVNICIAVTLHEAAATLHHAAVAKAITAGHHFHSKNTTMNSRALRLPSACSLRSLQSCPYSCTDGSGCCTSETSSCYCPCQSSCSHCCTDGTGCCSDMYSECMCSSTYNTASSVTQEDFTGSACNNHVDSITIPTNVCESGLLFECYGSIVKAAIYSGNTCSGTSIVAGAISGACNNNGDGTSFKWTCSGGAAPTPSATSRPLSPTPSPSKQASSPAPPSSTCGIACTSCSGGVCYRCANGYVLEQGVCVVNACNACVAGSSMTGDLIGTYDAIDRKSFVTTSKYIRIAPFRVCSFFTCPRSSVIPGNDILSTPYTTVATPDDCCAACCTYTGTLQCVAWTWSGLDGSCYIKHAGTFSLDVTLASSTYTGVVVASGVALLGSPTSTSTTIPIALVVGISIGGLILCCLIVACISYFVCVAPRKQHVVATQPHTSENLSAHSQKGVHVTNPMATASPGTNLAPAGHDVVPRYDFMPQATSGSAGRL